MIHVLIVDEAGHHYKKLRSILDKVDDFYLVGCARTLAELHYLLPISNQVLVASPLEGVAIDKLIATIHTTVAAESTVTIVVIDVANDSDLILHYIEMGVNGYVLAQELPDRLVTTARAAHQGKAFMSPAMAGDMLERIRELANQALVVAATAVAADPLKALTPRELEVLSLVAQGLTNRAVAETLVISIGTVKNHVHKILKKLQTRTRQEAAAIYRKNKD